MKKVLTILCILVLTTTCANAADRQFPKRHHIMPPPPKEMSQQEHKQREQAFEQRLGLTDAQKQQAKSLREAGFEKIKPVFDTLKAREQELLTVKQSSLSDDEKQAKIDSLKNDIHNLRKQAHEIKRENMKEFENLLTPEQKKILKEMKQEGRAKCHARCYARR